MQKKRLRRWWWRGLLVLTLVYVALGPRFTFNAWPQKQFARALQEVQNAPIRRGRGALFAGVAAVEITPRLGQPLAGYSARQTKANTGARQACYARALTLRAGELKVTFLTADMLLILQGMREAVLADTGLSPGEVYFMATHTHSGPGGWERGWLAEFVLGEYDEKYFQTLRGALARAINESRREENLRRVSASTARVAAGEFMVNRLYPAKPPSAPDLQALVLRPAQNSAEAAAVAGRDEIMAVLAIYAAHATVIGAASTAAAADYPGYFCEELRRLTGGAFVMFAAGAVGDARPQSSGQDWRAARQLGVALAKRLAPALKAAAADVDAPAELASAAAMVPTPKTRLGVLGPRWLLLPALMPHLMPRAEPLSVARLNNIYFTGWPADVAGELLAGLPRRLPAAADEFFLTSFSGGWHGYFTLPDTVWRLGAYETRLNNFSGPRAGEYFTLLTNEFLSRLATPGPVE